MSNWRREVCVMSSVPLWLVSIMVVSFWDSRVVESGGVVAAIDRHHRTGHEAGCRRAKEGDDAGHLGRFAPTRQRRALQNPPCQRLVCEQRRRQRRADEAG